jgi:non-ribosomal peptide synthetase-like protein
LGASSTLVDALGGDGPQENETLVVTGRPAGNTRTRPRTLPEVFAATAAAHPHELALVGPDAAMRFSELQAAADAVAMRLRGLGVGPGDRVGVRIASGTAALYVGILGVLIAGAAYVPVDADDAESRAQEIWRRAGVCALIGDELKITELAPTVGRIGAPRPADDAWVIFTSGSTGQPKGVAVSHAAAVAFVDAEAGLWNVGPRDRVLAGLSVGFDASCEEIWLAWRGGAALVPAPRELVRSGAELGPWIRRHAITVVSTVPSLAAIWDRDALGTVRLLILGGEACPESLGWALAERHEVWNTYGPTEATVVSTAARIRPGEPIVIGWALAGWDLVVIGPDDRIVAPGEEGELVIGGAGLARYIDPELDAERFAALSATGWGRAYRTGDIVRETPDGLAFIGRRDDQVKIAGRRIELGEVDARLRSAPGVVAAATVVRKSAGGSPLLVGYVTGDVQAGAVRSWVAEQLVAGLAPLVIVLDALPLSSSGKVDRKALPWPPPQSTASGLQPLADASPTAVWLAERWSEQLGPLPIGLDDDFFTLGGGSLAAATLASRLRRRFPSVAVADLYEYRTLGALAARLDSLGTGPDPVAPAAAPKPLRRLGLMQMAGVLVLLAIQSVPWLVGTLAYGNIAPIETPHVGWLWLIGAWLLLASPPARTALQVGLTRLLLRDLRPGRYPRYSWLVFRVWFIDRLAEVTRFERMAGTPWADRYARMVGADVGAGARLGTVPAAGSLLRIGAGATIESLVDMRGCWIDGQELVVGEIVIGAGARIGSRTLLNPGAVIGDGAEIEPGSVVTGEVPAGERWAGAPARRVGIAGEEWPATPPPAAAARSWSWLFSAGVVLEGLLAVLAFAPAIIVLALLGAPEPSVHTALGVIVLEAAAVAVLTVPVEAILIALTLRFVWRLVRPGWHSEHTVVGWALWFAGQLQTSSTTLLFPLYASLYTRPWFRLMGLKVGRRTEISVTTGLNPLVSFGELSQCTDDIGFCGVRARDGWLAVETIEIGDRSFLGPGAVLRGGTRIDDDSLVGVMTLPPRDPAKGTSWLGVPAIELPRVADRGDAARTVDPPPRLILARGAMDLLRLIAPTTIAMVTEVLEMIALALICEQLGLGAAVLLAPLVLLGGGVAATTVTVILKWTVIGRYRRSEHPLWSFFVWRDELINASQEQLADQLLLRFAIGTPIMSAYLRALGGCVGRGVWCETTAVTEYDMISLGDGSAVNRGGCLMTHLFHDRLLRIGPTELAAGATLGPTAVVLPDTTVGAGTVVCGHSVVLRGEELPAGTRWHGVPVAPAAPLR